jgi:protein TonB
VVLLSASAALHVAALGALLVIAGAPGPVLLVDLASVDLIAGSSGASGDPSPPAVAPAPVRDSRPARGLVRAAPPSRAAMPSARPAPPEVTEAAPAPPQSPRFELTREAPSAEGDARAAADEPTGHAAGTSDTESAGARAGAISNSTVGGAGLAGAGGGALLALAVPGEGRGTGVPAQYGPYLARFRQRIQEALVYPLAARRQGLSGTVELEVLVEPSGLIRSVRVVSSSSHALLDDAALDTVQELPPLPLPENLPRRPLRIRVPVVFRLR